MVKVNYLMVKGRLARVVMIGKHTPVCVCVRVCACVCVIDVLTERD